jgi:hypothetical protein
MSPFSFDVGKALQLELTNLQSDTELKQKFTSMKHDEIFGLLNESKYS